MTTDATAETAEPAGKGKGGKVPRTRTRKKFDINMGSTGRQQVGDALSNNAIGARVAKPLDKALAEIPDPYFTEIPEDGAVEWSMNDRERFAKCEAGINSLKTAFWVAGKALDTINSARLYKILGYATFESYVEERWDMGRHLAYRLIREWRLGEQMAPIAEQYDHKLSESHVRAIRDGFKPEGEDAERACVVIFEAIAGSTQKMTALVITRVVKHLPLDPGQADITLETIVPLVKEILASPEDDEPGQVKSAPAISPELKKAVERRGLDLADSLKTGRIPQSEIIRDLAEAFADPDDTDVFEAVLRRRKKLARKGE